MYGEKLSIVVDGLPGDEILKENLSVINSNPKNIKKYYGEMSRLCRAYQGYGLAANQVGIRENFFFTAPKTKLLRSHSGVLVINPEWSPHRDGKQYVAKDESCLSLPNINGIGNRRFKVTRWSKIVAAWWDSSGNRVKPRMLSDIAAHVFQHEADHLRGILLTDIGEEIKLH